MPVVMGVMGVDGNDADQGAFRAAMAVPASMPEFKDTVAAVRTANVWDSRLSEISSRVWKPRHKNADQKNEYTELRKKLRPLFHEETEARKLKGPERGETMTAITAQIQSIIYTAEEIELMKTSVANTPFNTLARPKFMVRLARPLR